MAQTDAANKKYDAATERLKKVNLAALSDSGRAQAITLWREQGSEAAPTSRQMNGRIWRSIT